MFRIVSILAISMLVHVAAARAATPGCNATDANCTPFDPCTYDVPAPGYECGLTTNNTTKNGTFITPAAKLGFTWAIPKAWFPDAWKQLVWDCGIGYDATNYPAGCTPIIAFDGHEPQEFLEQAPGFEAYEPTDPEHDEYFSYTFAWWLPGEVAVTAPALSTDFVSYYQGLMGWCFEDPGCEESNFKAHFAPVAEPGTCGGRGDEEFTGEVQIQEEFFTGNVITLNFFARKHYCANAGHTVVTFSASPEPRPGQGGSTKDSETVWAELLARQDAFACD